MSTMETGRHWVSRAADVTVPCRRADVTVEPLEGEAILADPRSGAIHRLNETAFRVWKACDGQRTTRQIADELTRLYDLEFEAALDWVEQLVAMFADLRCIE